MATPKDAARKTREAREAKAERERIARVAPRLRLAYSTSTRKDA